MKKPAHQLIAEVSGRQLRVEMRIGIDLGDVCSHYCTLNGEGLAAHSKPSAYGLGPMLLVSRRVSSSL